MPERFVSTPMKEGSATMTDDKRRMAVIALIRKHTDNVTTSVEAARKSLIDEGIYNEEGALTAEFGGRRRKAETAA